MADGTRSWVLRHAASLSRPWVDIVAVATVIVALALAVSVNAPPFVRVPLAFAVTFVVPGYVLVLGVFPRGKATDEVDRTGSRSDGGITVFDRAVLSVGASLSLVVCGGLVLNTVGISLSTEPLLGMLTAVTGAMIPFAVYRRRQTPEAERYVPLSSAGRDGGGQRSGSGQFDLLTVVLVLSVLFAGGAVAYSAGFEDDAGVTELYFEVPTVDDEGALGGDPTDMTAGQETRLNLTVSNREGERVRYAVVGQLQRVRDDGDDLVVQERESVYAGNTSLGSGEAETLSVSFVPPTAGEYRLVFLLFLEDAPTDPRTDSAYREVHLWVNVSEPTNTADP